MGFLTTKLLSCLNEEHFLMFSIKSKVAHSFEGRKTLQNLY